MQPNGWQAYVAPDHARSQKRQHVQEVYLQQQQDEANAAQEWFAGAGKAGKAARLDIITHHHQQGENA